MKNNIITFLTKTILAVALLFIAFSCENEDDGPEFTVTPPSEDVAFTNSFLDDYLLSAQTSANIAERLLWNTPSLVRKLLYHLLLKGRQLTSLQLPTLDTFHQVL